MNQCLLKLCQVGCYVFISYSFSSAQWLFFKCSSDKIKRYSYINISHAIICAKSQSTRLISSNCRLFYACLWAMFWQFFSTYLLPDCHHYYCLLWVNLSVHIKREGMIQRLTFTSRLRTLGPRRLKLFKRVVFIMWTIYKKRFSKMHPLSWWNRG